MKKTLFATLLIATLAVPFSAQAAGGYAGLNIGQSSYDFDDAGLTAVTRDEKDTAWKLYGGVELNRNFGVEVGYTNLGELRNVYSAGATRVGLSAKAHSLYVAGTGTLPLSEQFSLFGKLGLALNRSSATGATTGVRFSDTGTQAGVIAGVGTAFNFNKNMAVTLEYELYGKVAEDVDAQMVSVGLRYKF